MVGCNEIPVLHTAWHGSRCGHFGSRAKGARLGFGRAGQAMAFRIQVPGLAAIFQGNSYENLREDIDSRWSYPKFQRLCQKIPKMDDDTRGTPMTMETSIIDYDHSVITIKNDSFYCGNIRFD